MTRVPFEYVVLRAVPRVERGECVNVGLVLWCQARDYLGAVMEVDDARLRALDPDVDVEGVRAVLAAVGEACGGSGPAGDTTRGQRFRWLAAPRSTVVQPGPVHGGITADPAAELARLADRLVR